MAYKIFFVDDEPFVLTALSRVFKREGYNVFSATNGKEALRIMEETPLDLIIADQRMPEMTGIELLKIVKEKYPSTIRMVLSGYSDINEIISAINIGEVYRFITKPWNDSELLEIVRKALEQYELVHTFSSLFNKIVKNIDIASRINFETTQTHNNVRITVKDSDRPLNSDDMTKLLEFLFSAFSPSEDVSMGLKLASGIIEKQKGCVTLVTETDRGLTFIIDLPVKG